MEPGKLRRYTDTTAVLDALLHRHLVLLDPKFWDDKNDSYYIQEYARRSNYKAVLALCLTAESETYHHWRIFAGTSGACVVLRKRKFLKHMKDCGLICRPVIYRTNSEMQNEIVSDQLDDLPFLKRWAFRHEKEYRVIHKGVFVEQESHEIPFPLDLIDRIVLSPWTPRSLAVSFKTIVHSLPECGQLNVYRSALTDNETWKGAIELRND